MQYSFQILNRAFSHYKTLFCKVDCTAAEFALLKQSRVLKTPIYERDRNSEAKVQFAKACTRFLRASASREKDRRTAEQLRQKYLTAYVLKDFIAGVGLAVHPFDVPQAERTIEARLIEIGETVKMAMERLDERGRSHDV